MKKFYLVLFSLFFSVLSCDFEGSTEVLVKKIQLTEEQQAGLKKEICGFNKEFVDCLKAGLKDSSACVNVRNSKLRAVSGKYGISNDDFYPFLASVSKTLSDDIIRQNADCVSKALFGQGKIANQNSALKVADKIRICSLEYHKNIITAHDC